jgi:hypothetical protein
MKRPLVVAALLLASATLAAGPPAFRFVRPIVPAGAGPNRLDVDVPLLTGARRLQLDVAGRHAGGLDDLRIFGADGNEVPYLVVPPPVAERRWQSGTIEPVLPTKETSGFEVDLGAVVRVDRLRLTGLPAPFSKRVRLEGSGDRVRWVVLAAETTVFDLPEERLRRTEIAFEPSSVRHLRITWDDRASARLPPAAVASVALANDVVVPAPPVLSPLGFERRASEPGTSRFRIRLPGPGLPIRALELDCGGDRLLRPARVTEAALDGDAMTPHELGQATLRRLVRDDVVVADLRVPIATPHELELAVDDQDNPPLELRAVRAELPPLPWIYFESADGAGLSAKFGAADLAKPRYDLEAARGIARSEAARGATWGERMDLPEPPRSADAARDDVATVGAPVDLATFRWTRSLPPGPPGLTALRLDAAVLAHAPGLADVRLIDGTGHQVPYVVERVGEPLSLDLAPPAVEPQGSELGRARQTAYRLELPHARLPDARLVLETDGRVFERLVTVRVERARPDARDGRRFETVGTATWRHVDTERPPPPLTIALPPLDVTTVLIDVDDGDNSPLRVSSVRLLLPTRRLRFVRATGAEVVLAYGAPRLAAPRYDLSLLAPRILGASAHEIDPLPELAVGSEPGDATGEAVGRHVFWGVLGASVLVLLVVLARLVRVDERAKAA